MGVLSRMSSALSQRVNRALNRMEDPVQTLEYSYEMPLDVLQKLQRGRIELVAGRKRLGLQVAGIRPAMASMERGARQALAAGREDLAAAALERRPAAGWRLDALGPQLAGLQGEPDTRTQVGRRLAAGANALRRDREGIRAQCAAAQAGVRIGGAVAGLSAGMAEAGRTIRRIQDRTAGMRARASAIDALEGLGILRDGLRPADPGAAELVRRAPRAGVDRDLARLRAEAAAGVWVGVAVPPVRWAAAVRSGRRRRGARVPSAGPSAARALRSRSGG